MAKRWRVLPHDSDRIATLQRAAGIPAVVAQLLLGRGITHPEEARVFLDPKLSALRDPELLPGCAEAADRIHAAIHARRRMAVYGDYDVDGMTGAAILVRALRLLGAEVRSYIPHRIDEGYGLHREAMDSLVQGKAETIITVDCGIASVEEAAWARQRGVELVITDHHEPATVLPDADAIVHPCLPGTSYPFGGLSGSGVAMKLAWALCTRAHGAKKVSPAMRDFLLQAVGLAAMGTVADVVPLIDENRILVHHGLVSLTERPTLGVSTLLGLTKLDKKPRLDAEDVAFTLAPRFNAAGRLGQPQLALELLTTDRVDRAEELARYIDGLNSNRQTIERSILLAANKQAKEQLEAGECPALVLADRGWHAGVIGIVAGRLAEKYHRPVVLVALDPVGVKPGVGSARSVKGFNLHAALAACSDRLESFGGHAAAAGLKVREDQVEHFRADLCEFVAEEMAEECRTPELVIDAETPLSGFTRQAVEQIEQLAPFGQGNHRPLLCTSGVTLAEPPKPMGADGRHLAVRLTQHGVTMRAVAFGGGEWAEALGALRGPIDVAFRPVINSFRGAANVELHLVDWRASAS